MTPWTVARQAPVSMGFSSLSILEWVAMAFSRGSSDSGMEPEYLKSLVLAGEVLDQ